MIELFQTHAWKGTGYACLTCAVMVFPLPAAWLLATTALGFALVHFRASFRSLDEATPPETPRPVQAAHAETSLPVLTREAAPACDVNAVMATLASR